MKKIIFLIFLLFSTLLNSSCRKPSITAYFMPNYFCPGTKPIFHWTSNNIDRIQLKSVNSLALLDTKATKGDERLNNFEPNMQPLSLIGYQGDKSKSYTYGLFENIGNSIETIEYTNNSLDLGPEILVPTGTVEETAINGQMQWVTVYEVQREILGFKWNIPEDKFDIRAIVSEVRYAGPNWDTSIELQGTNFDHIISNNSYYIVSPEQKIKPGGNWYGKKIVKDIVVVAIQLGEDSNNRRNQVVMSNARLQFIITCQSN